jgi:membrane protease YdiL (CAAX protease family)
MKRFLIFLRSVLPADRANLLLIVGSCFLFISQRLRWWPDLSSAKWDAGPFATSVFSGVDLRRWALFVVFATLPILFAGAAGYFVCFWPGSKPARRLVWWVLLPATGGILLVSIGAVLQGFHRGIVAGSILESPIVRGGHVIRSAASLALDLGPGLHFALAGLLLAAIAAWLLNRGLSALPVRLTGSDLEASIAIGDSGDERVQGFVWYVLAINLLATALSADLVFIPFLMAGWFPRSAGGIGEFVGSLPFLVVVVWAMGTERWRSMWQVFRLPDPGVMGLAILFPLATACIVPVLFYLYDRIHWAVYYYGISSPPQLLSYFAFPAAQLLWHVPSAFVEEIGWRGYFQPRLIGRFGLFRGIVLVGIVWGAFHFGGDFRASMGHGGIALSLGTRLLMTLVLSFTLAWLTLGSGSILPAGLMHATYNILYYARVPEAFSFWLLMALWALLGIILFRYWPPKTEDDLATGGSPPCAEAGA